MNFFDEKHQAQWRDERTFYRVLLVILETIAILSYVLLFVFLRRENRILFFTLFVLASLVASLGNVYLGIYRIHTISTYLKTAKSLKNAKETEIQGKVLFSSKPLSTPYGMKMKLLTLGFEDKERDIYLPIYFLKDYQGKNISFLLKENIIVGETEGEEDAFDLFPPKSLKNSMKKSSLVVLASASILSLVTLWSGSLMLKPKKEESLRLFVTSYGTNAEPIKKALLSQVQNGLIDVDVLNYAPDTFAYGTVFETAGTVDTDILILPSHFFKEENYPSYLAPLNEALLNEYLPKDYASFSSYQEEKYGIEFWNKETKQKNLLSENINLEDKKNTADSYLLFFNKDSVNLGEKSENAYRALSVLFREEA